LFCVFSKPPALEKDADPSASLMGLLQNMYEEGDDEMKRTIKKAWYESQAGKKTPDFSME
jgi:calcyclin binding protein